MEVHLASCPQCIERLVALKRLALRSSDDGALEAALDAAQERVWQRLSRLEPATSVVRNQHPGIWRRRVSVPLPAVAVAAAALVVAATLMLTQTVPQTTDTMGVAQSPLVPVSTINEVLQYLGNQDATDIMLIRLPESKSFSSSGEPALIKAADYSRSKNTQ
ncbi:MAG: hypothetical protein LBJ41_10935 [Treponema sp.]|nr:hypothetical protein [Treponema sp.]